MTDPRVEAIADGLCSLVWALQTRSEARIPIDAAIRAAAKGDIPLPIDDFAQAALDALLAAGYTVAKLERGMLDDTEVEWFYRHITEEPT